MLNLKNTLYQIYAMAPDREYEFIFSRAYRVHRHLLFWIMHIIVFTIFAYPGLPVFGMVLFTTVLWIPVYMLYMYPVMYWMIPRFLITEKYRQFIVLICIWAILGLLLNFAFRAMVMIPLTGQFARMPMKDADKITVLKWTYKNVFVFGSYFALNAMLLLGCIIKLFQYWLEKQQQLLQSEKAKAIAELQVLKAQVHPHFLFNTLNNIYSFSMKQSEKAPAMIIRLSSLLSYMIYDCKAEMVLLEKEIEILTNYIELEQERYGESLEISLNINGSLGHHQIAPLLLLPFIENAFKHGASQELEKSWISIDIGVVRKNLYVKIINSYSDMPEQVNRGIGINNVKKRLEYLYTGNHELKISQEGGLYIVSIQLKLDSYIQNYPAQKKNLVMEKHSGL